MVERNFDEEFDYENAEGHAFTLGGYHFRTLPVAPPGAFLPGLRGLNAAVAFLRKIVVEEDRPNFERVVEQDVNARAIERLPKLLEAADLVVVAKEQGGRVELDAAVATLRAVLEEVAASEEKPSVIVSAYQVDQVASWLIEVTSGRPTPGPVSSGTGPDTTSDGSKESSPSPAETGGG
jgi:hypothetical protein